MVDDHPLFRKGLAKHLDPNNYELLFDVSDGAALMERINEHESNIPDVVIMDIEMKGMNGFETVAWLKLHHPDIAILVLSVVDTEDAVVRMLRLGVKGHLSKVMEPEEFHAALLAVSRGDYYFTDILTNRLVHTILQEKNSSNQKRELVSSHELWNSLNSRQREYVKYACTEMTYEEIADKMNVSPKTIDGYRDAVFGRLNVKNRVGLVLYAIKNKLVIP